jgi:hypothetical protein
MLCFVLLCSNSFTTFDWGGQPCRQQQCRQCRKVESAYVETTQFVDIYEFLCAHHVYYLKEWPPAESKQ